MDRRGRPVCVDRQQTGKTARETVRAPFPGQQDPRGVDDGSGHFESLADAGVQVSLPQKLRELDAIGEVVYLYGGRARRNGLGAQTVLTKTTPPGKTG
jgi:hypothetical protein